MLKFSSVRTIADEVTVTRVILTIREYMLTICAPKGVAPDCCLPPPELTYDSSYGEIKTVEEYVFDSPKNCPYCNPGIWG